MADTKIHDLPAAGAIQSGDEFPIARSPYGANDTYNIELGTAAQEDVGTGPNDVVQLDGSSALPSVVSGNTLVTNPTTSSQDSLQDTINDIHGGTQVQSDMGLSDDTEAAFIKDKCVRAAKNTSASNIAQFKVVGADITSGASQVGDVLNIAALSGQKAIGITLVAINTGVTTDSSLFVGPGNVTLTLPSGTPAAGNPIYFDASGNLTLTESGNSFCGYVQNVVSGLQVQAVCYFEGDISESGGSQADMGTSDTSSPSFVQNKNIRAAKNTSGSPIPPYTVVGADVESGVAQVGDVLNISGLVGQKAIGITLVGLAAGASADDAVFVGPGNVFLVIDNVTPSAGDDIYFDSEGTLSYTGTTGSWCGYVQYVGSSTDIDAVCYFEGDSSSAGQVNSDMAVSDYGLPAAVFNKGFVTVKNTSSLAITANHVLSYDVLEGTQLPSNIIPVTMYDTSVEPAFLLLQDLAAGATGPALRFGVQTVSLNAAGISAGDYLYADDTGTITNIDIGNEPVARSMETVAGGSPPINALISFDPALYYFAQSQSDFLQTDDQYANYIRNVGFFPVRNTTGSDIPTSCAVVQNKDFTGLSQNGYVEVAQYSSTDARKIIGITLAELPDSGTAGAFTFGQCQVSLPGTFSVSNGDYLYIQNDGTIDTTSSSICCGEVTADATANPVDAFISLSDYTDAAGITDVSGNIVTTVSPGVVTVNQVPADPTETDTSSPSYIVNKNISKGFNNSLVADIAQYQIVSVDAGNESTILDTDGQNVLPYDQTNPPIGLALAAIAHHSAITNPNTGDILNWGNVVVPYSAISGASDSTVAQSPVYVDDTGIMTLASGSPTLTQVGICQNNGGETSPSTILIYFAPLDFAPNGGPHGGVSGVLGSAVNNADQAYPVINRADWDAAPGTFTAIANQPTLGSLALLNSVDFDDLSADLQLNQQILATNVSASPIGTSYVVEYASSISGTPTITGEPIVLYSSGPIAGIVMTPLAAGSSGPIVTRGLVNVTIVDSGGGNIGDTVYANSVGELTVTFEQGLIPVGSVAESSSSSTITICFDPSSFQHAAEIPAGYFGVINSSGSSIPVSCAVCVNSGGTLDPSFVNVQRYNSGLSLPAIGISVSPISSGGASGYVFDESYSQITMSSGSASAGAFLYIDSNGLITTSSTPTRIGQALQTTATSSVWAYISLVKYETASGASLGTAAYKDASDDTQGTVASVSGATVVGNLLQSADIVGTVEDSAIAASDLTGLTGNVQDQIDALSGGGPFKKAAAVSAINITGSNPGTSTFDGTTITSGDYLLLTAQTSAPTNGIYVFNGSSSPVTRAPIMNTWDDVVGSEVSVPPSTTYPSGSIWRNTNANGGTLGTTAITFVEQTVDSNGVQTVTGTAVLNTDPANPVIDQPDCLTPVSAQPDFLKNQGAITGTNNSGSTIAAYSAVTIDDTGTATFTNQGIPVINVRTFAASLGLPIFGLASPGAITSGSSGPVLRDGNLNLPLTGYTAGDKILIDHTTGAITTSTTDSTWIGVALADTSGPDTPIYVNFASFPFLDIADSLVGSVTGTAVDDTDPANPVINQSDWNESSSSDPTYINNKPNLTGMVTGSGTPTVGQVAQFTGTGFQVIGVDVSGASYPYAWINGDQTSLVTACAASRWVVCTVDNTDTDAQIQLTQDTTFECQGGATIFCNRIDLNGFSCSFLNAKVNFDGVHNGDGTYGFFNADYNPSSRVFAENTTFFNGAADTTGDAINAINVPFETVGCVLHSGTAPNTLINFTGPHTDSKFFVENATCSDAILEPASSAGIVKNLNSCLIELTDYAGSVIGSFTVGVSFPTEELTLTMPGGFTEFPDYSAVRVTTQDFSSVLPDPLDPNTPYYVINVSSGIIKLAATYELAVAGTAISITDGGSGTFRIIQAQQIINCISNSCASDVSVFQSGGTNAEVSYFTLCGQHNIDVISDLSSAIIEFVNDDATDQLLLNSSFTGNIGSEGFILTNFTEDFLGRFIVNNVTANNYDRFVPIDIGGDWSLWSPTLQNCTFSGNVNLIGFGDVTLATNGGHVYVNNVIVVGAITVEATIRAKLDFVTSVSGEINISQSNHIICDSCECSEFTADTNEIVNVRSLLTTSTCTVSEFTEFHGFDLHLGGAAAFSITSGTAAIFFNGCGGNPTLTIDEGAGTITPYRPTGGNTSSYNVSIT